MIYKLYAVQDTLIGFSQPYVMVNEEVAKRDYQERLKTNPHASDMRLYKVGTFDDSTGTIIGETPKCIMGGGENGSN